MEITMMIPQAEIGLFFREICSRRKRTVEEELSRLLQHAYKKGMCADFQHNCMTEICIQGRHTRIKIDADTQAYIQEQADVARTSYNWVATVLISMVLWPHRRLARDMYRARTKVTSLS
ncbi:hypothetical protein COB55_05745 [Candidatus Wolfebacteria bacterium]|nr:MAG: hypothetical protein COB55_05745 [Candidatus Wolfebacteria bacterium]